MPYQTLFDEECQYRVHKRSVKVHNIAYSVTPIFHLLLLNNRKGLQVGGGGGGGGGSKCTILT